MKAAQVRIESIAAILMHNTTGLDRLNPLQQEIEGITGVKSNKRTLEQLERLSLLEWTANIYWDDEIGPYVPIDALEACIKHGARTFSKGKQVEAGLRVVIPEPGAPLEYSPRRKTLEALYADKNHVDKRSVVVQRARIIRTRPCFPVWALEFQLVFDAEVIGQDEVEKALHAAGRFKGLLDYRPRFGRFEVVRYEVAEVQG